MLKLYRDTKVKVFFLLLVYAGVLILANIDLFEFSASILEKAGPLFCVQSGLPKLALRYLQARVVTTQVSVVNQLKLE